MDGRSKIWLYLIVLAAADALIPVPIIGLMLMYVMLRKPAWFRAAVLETYGS